MYVRALPVVALRKPEASLQFVFVDPIASIDLLDQRFGRLFFRSSAQAVAAVLGELLLDCLLLAGVNALLPFLVHAFVRGRSSCGRSSRGRSSL